MASFQDILQQLGVANYPLTQPFGVHAGQHGYGPSGHLGVDYGTPLGTPLTMPSGVTSVSAHVDQAANGGWGNYLKLTYADGKQQILGHLSEFVGIAAGQTVDNPAAGQVYAKTGNSGNTTGPHLDISTKVGGRWVNPLGQTFSTPSINPTYLAKDKSGNQYKVILPNAKQIAQAAAAGAPMAPTVTDDQAAAKEIQSRGGQVMTTEQADALDSSSSSPLANFLGVTGGALKNGATEIAGGLVALTLLVAGVLLLGMSWSK